MNYGNIKFFATEDGAGIRTVLFVSGCRNRCPGCIQPETWDFGHGRVFDEEAENQVLDSLHPSYVAGLTLCGGEPFEPENQAALVPFLEKVRLLFPDKTIWSYSGYTFEQLNDPEHPSHTDLTDRMLGMLDVLVDGRFMQELASPMLPYRGSANQRVLDVQKSIVAGAPVLSPYGERHGRTIMDASKEIVPGNGPSGMAEPVTNETGHGMARGNGISKTGPVREGNRTQPAGPRPDTTALPPGAKAERPDIGTESKDDT